MVGGVWDRAFSVWGPQSMVNRRHEIWVFKSEDKQQQQTVVLGLWMTAVTLDPLKSDLLTAAVSMAFTLVTRGFATILSFRVVKKSSDVQNCWYNRHHGGGRGNTANAESITVEPYSPRDIYPGSRFQ